MPNVNDTLMGVLGHFEEQAQGFDEIEVTSALRARRKELGDREELKDAFRSDEMAFYFEETSEKTPSPWDTYFGPLATGTDKEGNRWEAPSIELVTQEVLCIWRTRCDQFSNPSMCARYADLVWDLSQKATGLKPDVAYARIAIDSYIQTANENRFKYYHQAVMKLRRAIGLALSINDKQRAQQAKTALIDLSARGQADGKPRWVRAYDCLVRDNSTLLDNSDKETIIGGLEEGLAICSDHRSKQGFHPFKTKEIALRLAEYYNRLSQRDDIRRVLGVFEAAFEPLCQQAMSLVAMSWYQWIHDAYKQYGLSGDAERVLGLMGDKGKGAADEMGVIEVKQEIPREELEKVFAWLTEGDLASALAKVAASFLPDIHQEKRTLLELTQDHPLLALMTVSVVDQDQVVAKAGSVTEDHDRRLLRHLAENLSFSVPLLMLYLDKVKERFSPTADQLLDVLFVSPLYDPHRRDLLGKGLSAYLEEDFITAGHVLVPQLEHMLRRFLAMVGGTVSKPNRYGGYQRKNLNDILREPVLRQVMGDGIALYLQALLADPLGWNIRNEVAHGLLTGSEFGRPLCDRLIHAMLVLGQCRTKKECVPGEDGGDELVSVNPT